VGPFVRVLILGSLLTLGAAAPPSMAPPVAPAPVGDPVLDPPTVRCLAVYWFIKDDDAQPAHVDVAYRKVGTTAWRNGPPLFRVRLRSFLDEGGRPKPPVLTPPEGAHLFAGSVFPLDPDTAYDLRLTLNGTAGSRVEKLLHARTLGEPVAPRDLVERHVVPGHGGGTGTKADPFRGLEAADKWARPGDLFLLHAGVYDAPWRVTKSGEPGRPIIWRGAGDGEAILDARRSHDNLTDHVIDARGRHDVWFEKLSADNAYSAVWVHEATRVVVRRCHLYGVICGVFGINNGTGRLGGLFISDNRMEGIMPWPATQQQWNNLPESRGVWITGTGNVACYNRLRNFKDGLDLEDCRTCCVSNDFYNNDVAEMFDDGSEMDGSDRNTRCFYNRFTDVLCGVSFQPVYGGPVYAFRNVIYNIRNEPFKLHNSPSGAVIVHNTSLRNGQALHLSTSDPIDNCYSCNNLLVGTSGRAYDCSPAATHCDFDYDGFAGWSGKVFIKWNNVWYPTPEAVRATCPIERHVLALDPAHLFQGGTTAPPDELRIYDGAKLNLRLAPGSGAIDAGTVLPGFNEDYRGAAPDLGAYESGTEPPHYGPRPEESPTAGAG
jgi:hypothetical protein